MKVGYARISSSEQSLDLQVDALRDAGCDDVFQDIMSGAKGDRPGLEQMLRFVREGDTVVVWKLDRLGRSMTHLIETMKFLEDKKVGFESICEKIDTSTITGKLIFHLFGSLAEFERGIIIERVKAGMKYAKEKGRLCGKKRTITDNVVKRMIELRESGTITVKEICKIHGISKQSFYLYYRKYKSE